MCFYLIIQYNKNKSTVFIKNGNYSENSISLPGDKEFSFIGESENGVVVTYMAKLRSFFLNSFFKCLFSFFEYLLLS